MNEYHQNLVTTYAQNLNWCMSHAGYVYIHMHACSMHISCNAWNWSWTGPCRDACSPCINKNLISLFNFDYHDSDLSNSCNSLESLQEILLLSMLTPHHCSRLWAFMTILVILLLFLLPTYMALLYASSYNIITMHYLVYNRMMIRWHNSFGYNGLLCRF